MTRVALVSLVIGMVALVLTVALGGASGTDVVRSGFAAWLVLIALPLGALPVLMAFELAGPVAPAAMSALRLILAILPLTAIIGLGALALATLLPNPLGLTTLYDWNGAAQGIAAHWFTPTWFALRSILYLAVWTALAVVFMIPATMPSAGRRQLAAGGLALHVVIGTLAAIDWTLSLDLGPNASDFGLLLISLQCAFALTVALLITATRNETMTSRGLSLATMVAVFAAAFMQFVQYLVVWSANLPREIVWYQHRLGGVGSALFVVAPLILIAAAAVLMPAGLAARRVPVLGATVLLAGLEVVDLLWLVTPAWRGSFSVSILDALALVGLAGVLGASAMVITSRTMAVRHG